MKLFLHTLAVAALSVCCLHTVSAAKQSVRASKTNMFDTRDVTVKIIGSAGPKKPISSSTFKTDTSGLRTGKLSFDFAQGIRGRGEDGTINTILAVYTDKPTEAFSISVSQKDVPKGSEIKIGRNTIEIDMSKVKNKKPEPRALPIVATVVLPPSSGYWRIITGSDDLKKARTAEFAKDVSLSTGGQDDINERLNRVYQGYPEILDDISCAGENCKVLIYANKPTRIYVKREQKGGSGYVTLLRQADINAAKNLKTNDMPNQWSAPLIAIYMNEKAKAIVTEIDYKHEMQYIKDVKKNQSMASSDPYYKYRY